jgi:hypothetical protein
VAAVAVVGVAVAVRPAPAPVAAAAAEGCVELPPPAAVTPAPGDTSMIGWSYRGDASVRGDVQELAVQQVGQLERVGAGEEEVLEAVPVLGKAIPLAGTSAIRHPVFASRSGRPPAGTCWSARPWSGRASRPVGSPRPSCRCRPRSAGS